MGTWRKILTAATSGRLPRAKDWFARLAAFSSVFVTLLAAAVFAWAPAVGAQNRITPSEAMRYVGKAATVCGQVASATYAMRSRGRPTFLNLDRPYPDEIFTVVIWGNNRRKFRTAPEKAFRGERVCVSGTVREYRGVPEIIVSDPSQIHGD